MTTNPPFALRVIQGRDLEEASISASDFAPPACRPGDRSEPLSIQASEAVMSVCSFATKLGLRQGLALSLVYERELFLGSVGQKDRARIATRVDGLAAATRVGGELGSVDAAYMSSLRGRREIQERRPRAGEQITLAVPMRLAMRLRALGVESPQLEDGDLEQAISWETAALIHGMTMSEWASLSLVQDLLVEG